MTLREAKTERRHGPPTRLADRMAVLGTESAFAVLAKARKSR
jgi:hypothetical protein